MTKITQFAVTRLTKFVEEQDGVGAVDCSVLGSIRRVLLALEYAEKRATKAERDLDEYRKRLRTLFGGEPQP